MAEKYYTCKQCNEEFQSARKKLYCSNQCSQDHRSLKRNPNAIRRGKREGKPQCVCVGCGKEYTNKRGSRKSGEGNKYCSRECAFKNGATSKYVRDGKEYDRPSPCTKVYFKVCEYCNNGFVAKRTNTPTCSDECTKKINNAKHYKRNSVKKTISTRSCKNCKRLFVAEYGNKQRLYCSVQCSVSQRGRVSKAKRRAVERSIEAENIDPFRVFDRDKWKCCLCGVKTLKSKRGSYDDRAPELDHIIPLSKGGKHTYINVQCACRKCNSAKSNKELGQLLLFG